MLLVNHFLLVFCALLFGRMLHSVLMFNVLDKGIKSKLYMLKKKYTLTDVFSFQT